MNYSITFTNGESKSNGTAVNAETLDIALTVNLRSGRANLDELEIYRKEMQRR